MLSDNKHIVPADNKHILNVCTGLSLLEIKFYLTINQSINLSLLNNTAKQPFIGSHNFFHGIMEERWRSLFF